MARLLLIMITVPALTAIVGFAEEPVGSAFTYQGQLTQNGAPLTGSPDFVFTLWDDPVGGNQVGETISTSNGYPVVDGLFTIELDFSPLPGQWIYDGRALWMEVSVDYPAGGGQWETLSPRQRLAAAPFASFSTLATAAPWAGILDMPADFADGVDDVGDGTFWSLSGNAGTSPGTNCLGTTDNVPFELHVNGQRALRIEPHGTAPNVIGGHANNSVATGAFGATIGGGASNAINTNGTWATISGGDLNEAGADSATVGGGWRNWATAVQSGVAAGGNNRAGGISSFVGGGYANNITGGQAVITGGIQNLASAACATVGGGSTNAVNGAYGSIGGGVDNAIGSVAGYSTIAGGRSNEATQEYATIPGGQENFAGGEWSFAAGRRAKVRRPEDVDTNGGDTNGDEGTFVWADSTGDEFWSTGPHQFLIRAAGGVGIGTNSPQAQLHVAAGGTLIPVRVDNTAAYGGPAIQVEQAYPTDVAYPVYGADIKVAGATAYGLYAETTQVDGDTTYGVYGKSASISATGYGYGGYFVSEGTNNGAGVYGRHPVRGVYGTTTGNGVGVYGRVTGATGRAVQGLALTSGYGPSYGGYFSSSGTDGIGLYGKAGGSAGRGVIGEATGTYGIGVYGAGDTGVKADATEEGGYALWADVSAGNGTAIYARSGASGGSAGHFVGNVQICDRSSGTTVIELGTGLDYAEGFDVVEGDDVRPGTVLVIDPEHPGQLAVARHAYDCKVAGIVAGANGLGSAVKLGSSQFDHDVALAGRVYCNAVAFDAPIEPGDLLTTSNVPGHAMKVQDHSRASGATLGKAMERLDAGRQGQILVLVTLQ